MNWIGLDYSKKHAGKNDDAAEGKLNDFQERMQKDYRLMNKTDFFLEDKGFFSGIRGIPIFFGYGLRLHF